MKKIILLLLLVLVSVSASARKSYINVYIFSDNYSRNSYIYLTGDVPKGIADVYYEYEGTKNEYGYFEGAIGIILNRLSEFGYEVELMNDEHYLLSKEISSGQTIIKGDVNTDGSVNISDISELVHIILDYVRANPSILEEPK